MKQIYFLFALLLCTHICQAQNNIITDRPGASDGSTTVPKGYTNFEMGSLFYVDADVEFWNINNSLFRYGVSEKLELRLLTNLNLYKFAVKENSELGISDTELGTKIGLVDNDKVQLAYIGHLVFPTGSPNSTLDQFGIRQRFSLSHSVSNNIGFTYYVGYDYFDQDFNTLAYAFSVGYGLTDNLSFFTEIYGDWFRLEQFNAAFDAGFAYLVNPNFQLDFSFGTGLNSDFNFYMFGASWQFPRTDN